MSVLRELVLGYTECAIWASSDEKTPSGGDPLDMNYGLEDIADVTVREIQKDCAEFFRLAKYILNSADDVRSDEYTTFEHAGHDFWLTRNDHGAGFWDGDWGIYGGVLTDISSAFGETHLYVGDDERIYSL